MKRKDQFQMLPSPSTLSPRTKAGFGSRMCTALALIKLMSSLQQHKNGYSKIRSPHFRLLSMGSITMSPCGDNHSNGHTPRWQAPKNLTMEPAANLGLNTAEIKKAK